MYNEYKDPEYMNIKLITFHEDPQSSNAPYEATTERIYQASYKRSYHHKFSLMTEKTFDKGFTRHKASPRNQSALGLLVVQQAIK